MMIKSKQLKYKNNKKVSTSSLQSENTETPIFVPNEWVRREWNISAISGVFPTDWREPWHQEGK